MRADATVFPNAPKEHRGGSANVGDWPQIGKWCRTSEGKLFRQSVARGNLEGVSGYARVLQVRRGHLYFDRPQSWIDRLLRA